MNMCQTSRVYRLLSSGSCAGCWRWTHLLRGVRHTPLSYTTVNQRYHMTLFMPAVKVSDEPSNLKEPRLKNTHSSMIICSGESLPAVHLPTGVLGLYDAWQILMFSLSSAVGPDTLSICWEAFFPLHGLT